MVVRISLLHVNVVKSLKTLCVSLKVIASVFLYLADCCFKYFYFLDKQFCKVNLIFYCIVKVMFGL